MLSRIVSQRTLPELLGIIHPCRLADLRVLSNFGSVHLFSSDAEDGKRSGTSEVVKHKAQLTHVRTLTRYSLIEAHI